MRQSKQMLISPNLEIIYNELRTYAQGKSCNQFEIAEEKWGSNIFRQKQHGRFRNKSMRTETRVLVKRGDSFAACDTIFRLLLYTRPSDRRTTALMPRNQLLFQDMLMNLISFKRVLLLRPILFVCFVQQMMSGKLLCSLIKTNLVVWYHFVVDIK